MFNVNSRLLFLGAFIYVSGLLLFGLYLQYFEDIIPCPLCMLQRVVFITLGVVALLACIHNPSIFGMRIYGTLNSVISLLGIGLASRHVWLENLPADQVPECGPSLANMLEYLPIFEALKNAVMGDGDCAKVVWSFMGLSIAMWSLLCFIALLFISLYIAIRPVGRF